MYYTASYAINAPKGPVSLGGLRNENWVISFLWVPVSGDDFWRVHGGIMARAFGGVKSGQGGHGAFAKSKADVPSRATATHPLTPSRQGKEEGNGCVRELVRIRILGIFGMILPVGQDVPAFSWKIGGRGVV